MSRKLWIGGAFFVALFLAAPEAKAWGRGRFISGGHPYHNGHLFIPPESAYSAVTYRPPVWFGAPAYYYPGSYLPAGGVLPGPVVYPSVQGPYSAVRQYRSAMGVPYYYPR
jgi:hypothetical protein